MTLTQKKMLRYVTIRLKWKTTILTQMPRRTVERHKLQSIQIT